MCRKNISEGLIYASHVCLGSQEFNVSHTCVADALKKEIVTLPSAFSIGTGTEVSGDKRPTPASLEILDPPRAHLVSSTNA